MDDYIKLQKQALSLLEPDCLPVHGINVVHEAQLSLAVSTKRIADALERIEDLLRKRSVPTR